MIPRHGLYIKIWRECLDQGFTTQDAREYAQMEIERLDREDKALGIVPIENKIVSAPKKIVDLIVSGPVKTPNLPGFIKPNSRGKDKMERLWQGVDWEELAGYY